MCNKQVWYDGMFANLTKCLHSFTNDRYKTLLSSFHLRVFRLTKVSLFNDVNRHQRRKPNVIAQEGNMILNFGVIFVKGISLAVSDTLFLKIFYIKARECNEVYVSITAQLKYLLIYLKFSSSS